MKLLILISIILIFLFLFTRFKTGKANDKQPDVIQNRRGNDQPDIIQNKRRHDRPDFSDWTLKDRLWKRKHREPYWDPYWNYYNPYPYYYPYYNYYQPAYTPTYDTTWKENGYRCFEDGKNGVPVKLSNNEVRVALDIPNKPCSTYINDPMGITTVRVCNKTSTSAECKPFTKLIM